MKIDDGNETKAPDYTDLMRCNNDLERINRVDWLLLGRFWYFQPLLAIKFV